jgi:superfamily I DNA/RNA helicase
VITARVAHLIERGVDPGGILAVTFTKKAATEMRERITRMVSDEAAKQVTISTFHSLCVRILRTGIDRLGYKNNFTIYDESDQLGLIRKIIIRTAAKDEKLDPNVATAGISRAKNQGIPPPNDDQALLGAVYRRYCAELKTANAVDFDDLLLLTVQLLRDHEDVRSRWQRKFRYLMVDEFQDTNRLQFELVRFLADQRRNVAVVGDDDQSIYGWRGAEISNILEFERHFPQPQVIRLEENYRSTTPILAVANSLIVHNPQRRSKKLWTAKTGGNKVRLVEAPNDSEETQFVVEEILRRQRESREPWENFAVLFRTNAQSRVLEENLRRLHIPYRIIGGKSFFDRREVKDLIGYMTVLINPSADASLLRIINTPSRGISSATIELGLRWSVQHKTSLWDALHSADCVGQLTSRAAIAIKKFIDLVASYRAQLGVPESVPAAVVTTLIEQIDYASELRRSCKSAEEAAERQENLRDVLRDLARFTGRSTKGLAGFLDEIVLDEQDEEEKEDDIERKRGVSLITMHAAKGLEFSHVYLVGLEEGLLPHDRAKAEGSIDEERRLLYVGITRARETLTLSYCRDRIKYGSASPCQPSSFIKELASEWIERVDLDKLLGEPVPATTAKSRFAEMRERITAQSDR